MERPQNDVVRAIHENELLELLPFLRKRRPNDDANWDDLRSAAASGTVFYLVRYDERNAGFYSLAEADEKRIKISDFCIESGRESFSNAAADFALNFLICQTEDAGYAEIITEIPQGDGKRLRFFRDRGFKTARSLAGDGVILLRRKLQ